jgi:antirestriction protein ArdC
MKQSVYEKLNAGLLAELEKAIESDTVAPWEKPWQGGRLPTRFATGTPYRAFNAIYLSLRIGAEGWQSSTFITYKAAQQAGGNVRKGEKGSTVEVWRPARSGRKAVAEGEERKPARMFMGAHSVFNIDQCDGVKDPWATGEERKHSPIEEAEKILAGMVKPPALTHGEPRCYYSPPEDRVNMARPELFDSGESYYATLFHEQVHGTGHASRLNRDSLTSLTGFGSHEYSKEELVAEFGASLLCGIAGIETRKTRDNSLAYLKNWLGRLRKDTSLAVEASRLAQRAVDHILGTTFESE